MVANVSQLAAAIALALATVAAPMARAQTASACALAYHQPVVNGASRTYASPTSASGSLTYTIVNAHGDRFDEQTSYVPTPPSGDSGTAAVAVNESDVYQCQDGALTQIRHDALASYSDGSTSTVSFFDFAGPLLPADPRPGASWDVAFTQQGVVSDGVSTERYEDHVTAVAVEPISVPAGTYSALRLEHSATTTPLDYDGPQRQFGWTEWLAQGVGPVKNEGRSLELASVSTTARAPSPAECASARSTLESLAQDMDSRNQQLGQALGQLDQALVIAPAEVAQAVAAGAIDAGQAEVTQSTLALLATHAAGLHSAIDGQPADVVFDSPQQSLVQLLVGDAATLAGLQLPIASALSAQASVTELETALSAGAADLSVANDLRAATAACP
jgi:hypothetical protein